MQVIDNGLIASNHQNICLIYRQEEAVEILKNRAPNR